jgi:hypothetical protein
MSIETTNKEGVCVRSAKNQRGLRLFGLRAPLLAALFGSVSFFATINFVQAANMQFSAEVTPPNACTMILGRDGELGISVDKKTLSSKIAGGLSGIVDVFSFGSFDVTADAPSGFSTAPASGNVGVSMATRFSGIDIFRGRTFSERDGDLPVTLRSGISITRLNIHLIATRPTEFPGGDYTGVVTVRCE